MVVVDDTEIMKVKEKECCVTRMRSVVLLRINESRGWFGHMNRFERS